jgi:hypothetical protein
MQHDTKIGRKIKELLEQRTKQKNDRHAKR